MGNLVTKITTNSVQLDESNVSEFAAALEVKKDESPKPTQQLNKGGLFKGLNILNNIDPRSPSTFITRTPIAIFQRNGKYNHQELNESLNETNESVDLDILTLAEQESLDSNKDLTDAVEETDLKLADCRSPSVEIDRTPILIPVAGEMTKKNSDDNLLKKIADKLISTKISETAENNVKKVSPTSEMPKKKLKEKNLIFEDEQEGENLDRFSTPPKKIESAGGQRTPLSCVGNSQSRRNIIKTSTPKSSKIPVARSGSSASKIPRKIN